jgi:hypothetical protein
MTTGLWNNSISEQRTAVAPPADIDKYMVVIGPTSSGSVGLRGPYASARALVTALGYGDTVDIAGQIVEQRQTNGSQVPSVPVAVYKTAAGTPGAYGAIDSSGVTGTAVPTADGTVLPHGTYRAAVKFVEGCTVGTTGGTFRMSLEEEPDWSAIAPKRLGTDTYIEIPNSGCKFNLDPPSAQVTAFITAVNEAATDLLAHLADVTAHNSADTSAAQVALAASSAAATGAQAWARMNLIRAAYESHRVNTTVHDGPDITNIISLAAATNIASGVALYNEFDVDYTAHIAAAPTNSAAGLKAATTVSTSPVTLTASDLLDAGEAALLAYPRKIVFTTAGGTASDAPATALITGTDYTGAAQTETVNLAQTATTATSTKWFKTITSIEYAVGDGTDATIAIGYAASVHNSADSTNTLSSTNPTQGTFAADDIFFVHTTAPQPSASDIDSAFTALAASGKLFGIAVCAFNATPTLVAHVTTGLNTCAGTNRIMLALMHSDMPDIETSETEEDWADSVETDYALGTVDDSRIIMFSSYVRETDARTTAVYRRPGFAQWCADVARVGINEVPCAPADQPATGLTIWTSDDVQVGHDEGPRGDVTGLSNADLGNRFVSTVSAADPVRGNAVYYTVPWTLAGADDPIKTLMMRRVANSMKRSAFSAAYGLDGTLLDYTAPDPNVPGDVYRLTDPSRNMLHGVIFGALAERFTDIIQNADDGDVESGLVWINPVITVAPGKLISGEYELRVRYKGVLTTLNGVYVVKE